MMQLKVLLSLFLSMNLGFLSPLAAASSDMQAVVDQLNYRKTLSGILEPAKEVFKTNEDHRQIDAMINKYEKQASKWLWRFELNKDNSISLRVNGKVQWTLRDYNPDNNSFVLKGEKVQWGKGTSFQMAQKKITDILLKRSVSLERLFVQEAYAIPVLGLIAGALAIGGVALFASRANAKSGGKCEISKEPALAQKTNLANFNNQIMCRSYPGNYEKRIGMVRDHFGTGSFSMFSTKKSTRHPYDPGCADHYSSMGDQSRALCRCIYRKQLGCQEGGWNMKPSMAVATCQAAHKSKYCKPGVAPSQGKPPQRDGGYEPISGDRPGIKPKAEQTDDATPEPTPEPYYEPISPATPATTPKTQQ